MPIIYKQTSKSNKLLPKDFDNEDELQKLLAESPELLMDDSEPTVSLVQREVPLGDAAHLDLLLVDSEGKPTAVEVKLARNSESRRHVVGQIFDYVSFLSLRTIDELNSDVGDSLSEVLRSITKDEIEFERCWKNCGTNLRAGQVRVVVAVDEAPEDLVRIIRFINDHSDLDVRLVTIKKYVTDLSEVILVPNLVVYGGGIKHSAKSSRTIRPKFQEVITEYEAIAPDGFKPRGRGISYRLIYPDEWPWQVHYELCDGEKIGVEIHLEGDNVRHLASTIQSFTDSVSALVPKATVQWNPKWSKNRGALEILFDQSVPSKEIASAMKTLIEHTKDKIAEEINKNTV